MSSEFNCRTVRRDQLVHETRGLRARGFRLVQISATRLADELELTYTFDHDSQLEHLRLSLPANGAHVPSISQVYWASFLYENELHDLFNIQIDGLAVDFHGSFYRTAIRFPFGSTKLPVVRASSSSSAGPTPQETVRTAVSDPLLPPKSVNSI